ncbi:MAG: hypothetical protein ACYCX7_07465 [Solirubrobacteraceae bacterium]
MLVLESTVRRRVACAAALSLVCAAASVPPALAHARLRAAHAASLRSREARASGGVSSQSDVNASSHTSVSLESCLAGGASESGAATFAAHMASVPGAVEMEMRFEILERAVGEASFHRPPGAGSAALGSWRQSAPRVGVFKDSDEVTGLVAGADYSARVRFRWLDAEGHAIAWAQRRTESCRQSGSAVSPTS